MNKHIQILLALFLLIPLSVRSQQQYHKTQYSITNGLSQNDVHGLFQDSQGFVWICTADGLNRYNGYYFKQYTMGDRGFDSSLPISINEDRQHNLWVTTSNRGLFIYLRAEDRFVALSSLDPSKHLHYRHNVRQVVIDSNDVVWGYDVVQSMVFSIHFDFEKHVVKQVKSYTYNNLPDLRVHRMHLMEDKPYFVSNYGLLTVTKSSVELKKIPLPYKNMYTSCQMDDRRLCISIGKALVMYNVKSKIHRTLFKQKQSRKVTYAQGYLWYTTYDGLYKAQISDFHGKGKPIKIDSYTDPKNHDIMVDRDGNVWVSFMKEGVFKYSPYHGAIDWFRGFGSNRIEQITYCADGTFLLGTDNDGLFSVSSLDKPDEAKQLIDYGVVWATERVADEDLSIVGTYSGLKYIKNQEIEKKPFLVPDKVTRVVETETNYAWIGTFGGGLYRFNRQTSETVQFDLRNGLPSLVVRNLMVDSRQNLWIATDKGVAVIPAAYKHKAYGQVEIKKIEDPQIANSYIIPMCEDREGTIYLGTLGEGLKCLENITPDFKYNLRVLNKKNGLPNNSIKAIEEDNQGKIWFSSNSGLSSFDPVTEKIITYDVLDGLQSMEFNELSSGKDDQGALYFGGNNGINRIRPELFIADTLITKPLITDFLLFNKTVIDNDSLGILFPQNITKVEKIRLNYTQNSFSFHFAANVFDQAYKLKYRYRMVNLEKEWIETTSRNRTATYTHLSPGHYTFELQSSNRNGEWTGEVARVKLIITPPFWATWQAYAVYALLAIYIIVLLYRHNIQRIKRRQEVKLARYEKKRNEEITDMKIRFFTNISHEFRTPLTLILSPLQQLIDSSKYRGDKDLFARLQSMHHNGNILLRLINELLNFAKNEQGTLHIEYAKKDIARHLHSVAGQFAAIAQKKGVALNITCPSSTVSMYYDPNLIEEVVYNLLSNALKHTKQGEHVNFVLNDQADAVEIIIADSGEGISEEKQALVFKRFFSEASSSEPQTGGTGIGLYLTKTIVELHDGHIQLESTEGKGTTCTVIIPKPTRVSLEDTARMDVEASEDTTSLATTLDIEEVNEPLSDEEDDEFALPETPMKLPVLMIVDDNEEIRELVSSLFKDAFKVVTAEDGLKAWEVIPDVLPDIVISDIMMPNMDGYALCEQIKTDARTSHVPVVLLSAKSSVDDKARGYNSQADAYCVKPFDNKELRALVQAILANRAVLARSSQDAYNFSSIEITSNRTDREFMEKLFAFIDQHISNPELNLDMICQEMGASSYQLNKKLKTLYGFTTNAFVRSYRLKRAAYLLRHGQDAISEICYSVGFTDPTYFRKCFVKEYSVPPQQYREKTQVN